MMSQFARSIGRAPLTPGLRGDGQPLVAVANAHVALKVGIVVVVGLAQILIGSTDRWVNLLSGGSVPARIVVFAVLTGVGIAVAPRIGLSLDSVNARRPFFTAALVALGVAAFCALIDGLFKPFLNHGYVALITNSDVGARQMGFAMRSIVESIIYRLFLGSLFVWLIGSFWRKPTGEIAEGAYIAGFTCAQLVNIASNMAGFMPINALTLTYYAFRHLVPGVVWGLVYRKYGFVTNEMAVGMVHFFFQPLVMAMLQLGL